MGETKSSKGVSESKKAVRKETVSKLENYTDSIEFVGLDFSPKDRIYERDESGTEEGGATDEATGKKEADIGQNLYISVGNTVEYVFNPQELSKQHLQMSIKGKTAQKTARKSKEEAEQEQNGQEK